VASGAALQLQGGISVGAEALTLNGSGVSDDGALRGIVARLTLLPGAITARRRLTPQLGLRPARPQRPR
jgi:hypothetical protein